MATVWETLQRRVWNNGQLGNTALEKARLDPLEQDVARALYALARDPEALFAGAVTRNTDNAPTSAVVEWPDGKTGTYSGTASTEFPGSIDSYAITWAGPVTVTFTQPAVTRNTAGHITNRPPITVT